MATFNVTLDMADSTIIQAALSNVMHRCNNRTGECPACATLRDLISRLVEAETGVVTQ